MNNKPRPIILSIHHVGAEKFRRHVISDQWLRYYTGSGWDLDLKKALLYHDSPAACQAVHEILLAEFDGTKVRRFQAPIQIELFAGEDISIEDLRRWLTDVAKLLMDSPKYGNGPMQGTLGLTSIDWDQLKESHNND